MGLQALSQIAAKIYQPHFTPITVTVDWSVDGRHESRTVTLNDTSRLLLQKIAVPIEVRGGGFRMLSLKINVVNSLYLSL